MVWSACFMAGLLTQVPPPRDWNQPYGNPAASSACDVEPIRGQPIEAWRLKSDGVLAGPAVNNELLYVVVREGKERKLLAIRPATGEIVARKTLDKGGDDVQLVASMGLAVVVEPAGAKTFRVFGELLKMERSLAGPLTGIPVALGSRLLCRQPGGKPSALFDLLTGKKSGELDFPIGRAAVAAPDDNHLIAGGLLGEDVAKNTQFGTRGVDLAVTPIVARGDTWWLCAPLHDGVAAADAVAIPTFTDYLSNSVWYLFFRGHPDACGLFVDQKTIPIPFLDAPVSRGMTLLGFTPDEELVELDTDSARTNAEGVRYRKLVPAGQLPQGARRGAPSLARDVLYLGNWAIELGSKRVLWCVDSLACVGPLIPIGDSLAVARTEKGDLVGLRDPSLAPAPPSGPTAGPTADGKSSTPPARPKSPSEDPALAAQLADDEPATFDACVVALRADFVDVLLAAFERAADFKFFDECSRLIREAKEFGLDAARAEALAKRIAGKASNAAGNADVQRKKLLADELAAREKFVARIDAAADWCAAQKYPCAATALVAQTAKFVPSRKVAPARVTAWIPAAAPWPAELAPKLWLEWASALIASGARFVPAADPRWQKVAGSPFAKETLALATKNLLLFTREQDAATIGRCLERAEAAVRALDRLLGKSPVGIESKEPLEIRLHRNRAEYLVDKSAGEAPDAWSAGFYSPAEGVSRFYANHAQDEGDPLGRELHNVMAHELTHHYVDRRWLPGGGKSAKLAGYWLVEGFAEFVSEQAIEMGRRGAALDDATVRSLDIAAELKRNDKLMLPETLVGLSYASFRSDLAAHSGEPGNELGTITLRHTLGRIKVDQIGLFYAESSALTFFALRRCGEQGAKGYVELLEGYYRGRRDEAPWLKLGFADPKAMREAFNQFLERL